MTLSDIFRPESDRTFIIAEIGVNHNGDMDLGRKLIDAAVDCGADAVKFQTFRAEQLVSEDASKAAYQEQNDPNGGATQFEMLRRLELDEAGHLAMKEHCQKRSIRFLSTPFGEDAADLLERMTVDGFKISSGDLTNLPLLAHIAAKGLPMLVSTGMGTLGEVETAIETIKANGNPPVALLHCVSNYPAPPSSANLRAMNTMKQAFQIPVGWSDHTLGCAVSIGAVAMGARIIEKHITLDVNLPGPDHKASICPEEFKKMVDQIRIIESALGDGVKIPTAAELEVAKVVRRSLVARRALKKGAMLEPSDLVMKRPAGGLPGNAITLVIGKKLRVDLGEGEPLALGMVE